MATNIEIIEFQLPNLALNYNRHPKLQEEINNSDELRALLQAHFEAEDAITKYVFRMFFEHLDEHKAKGE